MPESADFQAVFGAALAGRIPTADPSLARAVAIHRNTSAKAAQTAIADNFPVIRTMVGDEAFNAVAHDFVETAPPVDPRLCLYGAGFATFLDTYPPFADHRYLADVARIERLVIEALFAADAKARDPASFGNLDLDAPLRLHPAVRVAWVASPAGSLWLAHQSDAPADALESVDWAAECVLVSRPGNLIAVSVETPAATAFIEACANGVPLGEAAGAVGETLPEVFARTISAGCFA